MNKWTNGSVKKLMHTIFWYSLVLLSFAITGCWSMPFSEAAFTASTSSLDLFSYDIDNIPDIGTVYHYEKSNTDGSSMANEWIYIASGTHTESFKIYPGAKLQRATDLVIADYDSTGFYTNTLNAYLVKSTGERKLNASLTSKDGETYNTIIGNSNYDIVVGHFPSFNYNFDWCDLAFMYRHLIKKDGNFTTGVTVPNSFIKMIYAGKADFKYLGIIDHNNRTCMQYEVSGEAFKDEKGCMYTDSTTGAVIEINMPVKNNGSYNSFKFVLVDSQQMTKTEWDVFILNKTEEALK